MNTNRKLGASAAAAILVAVFASFAAAPASAQARVRPSGDARTLAAGPAPGFPEGIAVKGNRVYVSGPATFGTAGKPPSTVVAFNRDTGALEATYETQGEYLA